MASTNLVSVVTGIFLLFVGLFFTRTAVANLAATTLLLAWRLPSARLKDYRVYLLLRSTWLAWDGTEGGGKGGSRRHGEELALGSLHVPVPIPLQSNIGGYFLRISLLVIDHSVFP